MSGSQAATTSSVENNPWRGLVPTQDTLNILQGVDLTSFDESQQSHQEHGSFSDDPFDSQDLVGLCTHSDAPPNVSVKTGTNGLQDRLPSSPLFVRAESLPQGLQNALQKSSTIQSEPKSKCSSPLRPTSPQVKVEMSSRSTLLQGSPQKKRPRIESARTFSTAARQESTAESPQNPINHNSNTHSGLRKVPLSNPTIQLATQKPMHIAWEQDPRSQAQIATRAKKVVPFILSREQKYVMDLVLKGESLFFTGSAGTGKSVLLKKIIKELKSKYSPDKIAITASTGLAAHHVGGTTVHSFSGIGLGNSDINTLLKQVKRNRAALQRWKNIRVLIIDEISMIDGRLLDKLDKIARNLRRKKDVPFGGIQLVLSGDFFQLPPVSKTQYNADGTAHKDDAMFAFESDAWNECIKSSIILEEVFRQKGDEKFIEMLNDMRNGLVTAESEREFLRLSRPLSCPAGIVPAELYATRSEVDRANNLQLARLEGETYLYEAIDSGTLSSTVKSAILSNFLAPPRLHLKKGAQVMCLKNFEDGLVNGSIGKVIEFVDRDVYMGREMMEQHPDLDYQEYKAKLLKKKIEVSSLLPVKGEEQNYVKKESMLDNVFDFFYDDNYDVEDKPTEESKERLDPFEENRRRKIRLLERLEKLSRKAKYPLVRFTNPDNVTTRDVLMEPERWEHVNENDEVLVSRLQLPLMLAWALSIHKSQGLTLSHVKVNLGRIFEYGQAYVALSRAVSRDSLQVVNFRSERIRSNRIVEDFYKTLMTVNEHRNRG